MRAHRLWLTSLIVAPLAVGASLNAIERTKFPTFALTSSNGHPITSDALLRSGRWLVMYVPPNCAHCESLLRVVVKADHPIVPTRLVVIVGGVAADTLLMGKARFPDLADAAWYADPSGASIAPLRLGTSPAIFGLNGDMIEWSLEGVLSPTPEITSVLVNWVQGS